MNCINKKECVYTDLYDYVQNLEGDYKLDISREAFDLGQHTELGQINLSGLYCLNGEDYFYALYKALFHRIPEPEEVNRWKKRWETESVSDYRRELLENLLQSEEMEIKNIQCLYNIYAPGIGGTEGIGQMKMKNGWKLRLKAMLRKLPFDGYNKLKRLMGKSV